MRLMEQSLKLTFFILTFMFINECFSQQTEPSVAIHFQVTENSDIYSFTSITEYNEIAVHQRVERMKGLTGDESITVSNSDSKIFISLNPEKTNGDNLHRLLLIIVRLHGYEGYTITQ